MDTDKVFWILDFDVILSKNHAVQKGRRPAIQEFKEYFNELKKNNENVVIVVNNPCVEFWLLLHFEATGKFFEACKGSIKQLMKYLPNYEKNEKYYTKLNNDIYTILKPRMDFAIKNARNLGAFDLQNPFVAMAEMYVLFERHGITE